MTIKRSTFYGVIGPASDASFYFTMSDKEIVFRGSATAAHRYAKKHGGAEAGYSVVVGGGPVGTPWKGPEARYPFRARKKHGGAEAGYSIVVENRIAARRYAEWESK